ncbi:MAG: hypothetical protein ACETVY_02790 [Candidatus Bathyarchaeia archaeon]
MGLEELSDENLVWFYREELEMIDIGDRTTRLIPKPVKRRMISLGILEYRKGLDRTSGVVLSPRGREMLDSYKKAGVREPQGP